MVELCLISSHGYYPPGAATKQDFSQLLPCNGSNQHLLNPISFQKDDWRSSVRLLESGKFIRVDSMSRQPSLVGFQDSDSEVFSFGIVERLAKHEKILKLLASGSIEEDRLLVDDLSMIYNMMAEPFVPSFNDAENLVYPTNELYVKEPFLELIGDRSILYHPDSCNGSDMNDILSAISKKTNKPSSQTLLVPFFERRRRPSTKTNASKLVADKLLKGKEKTSQKKKTNRRTIKERDDYLHACESLLSIIFNRKQHGENTIMSLKKSGTQLPQLLTQFSASIAGTGVAVVLSVICRVAWTKVPLCASKLLSTGLGLGLVWLSWAVSRLRDTVVSVSKCSGKLGEKEEEIMSNLDRNLKDICFRAMALMAVVVLKIA